MTSGTVSEIDVLIAVARWLWIERRVLPFHFSIARGQGIDVEQSRRSLEAAMNSLEIPEELNKYRSYSGTGPDLKGLSKDEYWKIECKGLGAGKNPTHRNHFDRALASTVSYYEDRVNEWPDHKPIIGLALPEAPVFKSLLKSKVRRPLRSRLNLWVLLFNLDDSSITPIEPAADYDAAE